MKAIVRSEYGSPKWLSLREVPIRAPEAGEVLVRGRILDEPAQALACDQAELEDCE